MSVGSAELIEERSYRPCVAIVGAGPGDPGLITVKALELVRRCQVLVYDRLVSHELVAEAEHAIRVARDGLTQERVNELLVRQGRRGRRIVRLKGGDPFVFGRGAEEVDALEAAGVRYEVVPGVSTLTALPGLAGIPLTTRGVADQVTVISGTRADGGELDFRRLAETPGTIVVFMGLHRLDRIADGLIAAGRPPHEGAAVASRLSLPGFDLRAGTLATIAALAEGLPTPALVVIGDVVDLAARPQALWSAVAIDVP
jgi:uroporphyrin-III C-methyltransferase